MGEGREELKQKPANPGGPKVTSNFEMGNPTMPRPAAKASQVDSCPHHLVEGGQAEQMPGNPSQLSCSWAGTGWVMIQRDLVRVQYCASVSPFTQ